MNIKINRSIPIDELTEMWAMYSYKFYHIQSITKDELKNFKKINSLLNSKNISILEMYDDDKKIYSLTYFFNARKFKEKLLLINEMKH